jgi:glyceraldehyde 3-phosphate dehydrogenase
MAPLRVAINGFGRIGRLVFRIGLKHPELIKFVAINDLYPSDSLAYLLKYDSTHGRFRGNVESSSEGLIVNGELIPCYAQRNPAELPWQDLKVDYAMECTGLFTNYDSAVSHIQAGARRVIISAPTSEKDPEKVPTFVYGVNHERFDPDRHVVVSNASCTTNCLAPVAKVIQDNFGLSEGLMTTVHALTSTQPTLDGPSRKDLRGSRGACQNIIPASTGAAKAVGLVLPELQGRLSGMAFRIPTPDVSVVDLTFRTETSTSYRDICEAMRDKGILGYTDEPVVSTDFMEDPRSSIFDAGAGMELNERFFKVVAWYDNEWGYSSRMIDLMIAMSQKEQGAKSTLLTV